MTLSFRRIVFRKSGISRDFVYCFESDSGPLFVIVPNSPLEVRSIVPFNDAPFTVPWNVSSAEPPRGNCCCPENVTASFDTMPEVIGT